MKSRKLTIHKSAIDKIGGKTAAGTDTSQSKRATKYTESTKLLYSDST